MGNKNSHPPKPSPKRISLKAWKKTREKASKKELIEEIKQVTPKTRHFPQPPYYNILVTGQISSGKSSFFNSINSIFTRRIFQMAEPGEFARSLTKEFRRYELRSSPSSKPMHFRIMDTLGLVNTSEECYNEHDVRNILACVDGNVPDKYEFIPGKEFHHGCLGFIHNPPLQDQAHCVCIVVDVSTFANMGKPILRKIKSLITGLKERKLPILFLLTKIDLFGCPSVDFKLENVFRSNMIRDECIKPMREKLHPYNAHMEQFLPIKNYVKGIELDDSTDFLLLLALSEMLKNCQEYLDSK